MDAQRVAIMVDGDNISPTHATKIMVEAAKIGRIDVARVYAATNNTSGWLSLPGYRVMQAGTGKNASDLLLCIDAMELALTGGIDGFVVASSDGDFAHLALRLRERGLHVQGLGEDKAPEGFRAACSRFLKLTGPKPCDSAKTSEGPTGSNANPQGISDLDRNIRTMIGQHSKKGQGMRIVDLAPKMHSAHGIRISTYPERCWRGYLKNRPNLYDLDPRGPEALVRFRPDGFAAG